VQNATRCFYALQGAGIKYPGVQPRISLELYRSAVRSVLDYGVSSIYINKKNIDKLDKLQNKLIRQCIGLKYYCHIKPVLKATGLMPMSSVISKGTLDLLRKCVLNDSLARTFYCKTLFLWEGQTNKTLIGRAKGYAHKYKIVILKYVNDNQYIYNCKYKFNTTIENGSNGVNDTVRSLLYMNNYEKIDNELLNMLLKAF
jgi:hypothetical protein